MTTTTPTEAMPHPILTPIIGKPDQRKLSLLISQVLANTRAISSEDGDGRLGHAYIILGQAAYTAASQGNVAFVVPIKPDKPVHAANATQALMYRHDQTYKNELDAWKIYHKTEDQILQQILNAVNDTYTKALKDRMWGYGNNSPFDIITHLVTTYEGTGDALCNAVSAVVATLHATGLFIHPLREWNKPTPENRTLTPFKEFFRDAEIVRQTETTVSAEGYHQRAKATITDTQTVITGTSTLNHPQLIDIATITRILQESLRETQAANATTTTPAESPAGRSDRANTSIVGLTAAELDAMGWCWTLGYCHNPAHNSDT
ncbi:hypothetical protein SEMRO_504_G155950.1 [Seminavis robusta]|uniref:Uncharacterized protein n=1 Tax=Seminavis robusta TaxID=568900 RepID=A0A9N8DZK8_9STRA|nr:hypothetical protein SEMRO_504_G155950.1 [Seminavis robusta]|eukprot:Sro504_g155950.1 n/a (319) ;mRNA; r:22309-23383